MENAVLCRYSSERVGVHHSSLKEGTRRLVKEQLKQGTLSIVIATVGFGMAMEIDNTLHKSKFQHLSFQLQGIDIPDIRLVITYGLPSTLEELFQVNPFTTELQLLSLQKMCCSDDRQSRP